MISSPRISIYEENHFSSTQTDTRNNKELAWSGYMEIVTYFFSC